MTLLNFPPTNGQPTDGTFTYTANGVIYAWDGEKWTANSEQGLDGRFVEVPGDTMTGDLIIDGADLTAVNGTFSGTVDVGGGNSIIYSNGSAAFTYPFSPLASELLSISSGTGAPTKKFTVEASGTTKIGGTLPASPNITLDADGSGTFSGDLSAANTVFSGVRHQFGLTQTNAANLSVTTAGNAGGQYLISLLSGSDIANECRSGVRFGGSSGGHNAGILGGHTTSGRTILEFQTDDFAGSAPNLKTKAILDYDGAFKVGGTYASPNITLNADGNFYAIGVHNSTNSTISANVGVFNTGQLRRITSSSKYKTDIEDITDEYADKALQLRPVWYRSLCEGDEGKSAYGFIAEEVAQVEPRLASYDAEGNPDGVNYAMLVVHLTDIAQRQQARIEALEAEVQALKGG